MAVEIIDDIIDGASTQMMAGRVVQIVRMVQVTGLSSSANLIQDVYAELAAATNAIKHGDAHPADADMYVEDITIASNRGPYNATVAITYRYQSVEPMLLSGNAGMEMVQRNTYPITQPSTNTIRSASDTTITEGPGQQIVLGPHPQFALAGETTQDQDGDDVDLRLQGASYTGGTPRASWTMMNTLPSAVGGIDFLNHMRNVTGCVSKSPGQSSGSDPTGHPHFTDDKCLFSNVSMEPVLYAKLGSFWNCIRARFFYDIQYKDEGWNPITIYGTNSSDGQFVLEANGPEARKDIMHYPRMDFASISSLVTTRSTTI